MTTATGSVVDAFADKSQAQQAIDELQQAGFQPNQIRYSVYRPGTQITDWLEQLALPEQETNFYNREFEAGHTVVTVLTADRQSEADEILRRCGGYDTNSQVAQEDRSGSQASSDREEEQRLRLREEQLRTHKEPVETGEARLHKDVVSEEKSVDVPTTREEVYVERRPRSGEPADQPIGESETYRVPVREEQVRVEKQPVVREEVSMGKRPVEDSQKVSDTVRREEAHVEHQGDVNIQGTDQDKQGQ